MDDFLNLVNDFSTQAIQIIRTTQGQDPAPVTSTGAVTSPWNSSGLFILGVLGILIFVYLLQRK